ncbi:MAG: dephospho-CoA kinase [Bacillota bacterium]
MYIIGLTGGIASGKSVVAEMLKEKGAYLVDADKLAREAVEPGRPAWQALVDWLGESILLTDQSIDRVKLAKLVFNDRQMLEKLNKIVHPWVGSRFIAISEEIEKKNPEAVLVYDVPLLIEAGMQEAVNHVLLVYVPRELQIKRLQQRDNLTRNEAELRLKAQIPLEDKINYADTVIDNSASLSETARQVDQFWQAVIRRDINN